MFNQLLALFESKPQLGRSIKRSVAEFIKKQRAKGSEKSRAEDSEKKIYDLVISQGL